MINRTLKIEIMDAVQVAVNKYLSSTRGAHFAGVTAKVKRPREQAVLVTGLRDSFDQTSSGLEITIKEI